MNPQSSTPEVYIKSTNKKLKSTASFNHGLLNLFQQVLIITGCWIYSATVKAKQLVWRKSKRHGTVFSCLKHVTMKYINQSYKKTRFFNFPNEGGMVPDILLLYKSKLTRLLRFPSSGGIVPWMLFLYSSLHPTKRESQLKPTNMKIGKNKENRTKC